MYVYQIKSLVFYNNKTRHKC